MSNNDMNANDSVNELIAIADNEGTLVPPRGTEARGRILAIANVLNETGGHSLMLEVHAKVAAVVGGTLGRELEVAWDGIGAWQS